MSMYIISNSFLKRKDVFQNETQTRWALAKKGDFAER